MVNSSPVDRMPRCVYFWEYRRCETQLHAPTCGQGNKRKAMRRGFLLVLASAVVPVTLLSLLMVPLTVSPVSAEANLVQNPGFEEPAAGGSGDPPSGWSYSTSSPYRDVPPNVHEGSFSAYLHGSSGSYTQTTLSIVANAVYRFEVYVRANTSATATVTLRIRNEVGDTLDERSWSGSDHGWVRRIVYLTTPVNSWDAVTILEISGDSAAEAWFDDILLEEKSVTECFVATAAYSSYLDSHVETLRDFRDTHLVTDPVGSGLASAYYRLSPPIAKFIDDHPALRPMVRAGLLPAVALSAVAVDSTVAAKMATAGLILCVSALAAVWVRRKAISVRS